jgi:hypothetical protein
MRRIKREGFLRKNLAPLFGFYPWRCSICGTVQLLRARGERKSTRNADNPRGEAPAIQHANRAENVPVDSE